MELRKNTNAVVPKVPRGGSREAIVEAASHLFLERGFGLVSMDELAEAAGVARRTLYNQFTSKEEIFREMLLRVSGHLEDVFPPGVETQGDVEEVLRLVARMILELHGRPEYLGFLRMVVANFRQFPWIAEEFAAVMDPQTERLARYIAHLTAMGILECHNPTLAAHQFMGILNEFSLWPWMMGRERLAVPAEEVVEENSSDIPSKLPPPGVEGTRSRRCRVNPTESPLLRARHMCFAISKNTVFDWRHYLAVLQRKPGAVRNGAPFTELPLAFRTLQQRMLKTPGGDREMVEILALVLQHDEQAVLTVASHR